MFIIGTLFFIFGFVTWLNGSLIPFLKIICDLNEFEALFVTFAFYIAYTVMAFPMAYVLEKTGYKRGMSLGLGVMSIGSLIFIPAAFSGMYILFLIALFTLGTGLTILQTASNPYIVLIGPIESAAKRISIMGLINKSAGVLAPLVFTFLVLSDMPSGEELMSIDKTGLAQQLVIPYMIMACTLLILALFILFSKLQELSFSEDSCDDGSVFAFPKVVLGAVALFFYVGIEVIAGDTIGLYAQSIGAENATAMTAYTMFFMVMGYIVGVVAIPKYLSQQKALVISAYIGMLFLIWAAFSSQTSNAYSEFLWGWSGIATVADSVMFVALLGFANALVWPAIWPLALEGLGKYTAKASALLIIAIAGGALLPLVFAQVAKYVESMQLAYLSGIVCYLFILMYALSWHKKKSW
ncbi:MAG: glucose/galactose MFS transporter [Campylobacterales bacterium]|nr:glucose/galactose MFS transporter [Campylobacterales bacterium]